MAERPTRPRKRRSKTEVAKDRFEVTLEWIGGFNPDVLSDLADVLVERYPRTAKLLWDELRRHMGPQSAPTVASSYGPTTHTLVPGMPGGPDPTAPRPAQASAGPSKREQQERVRASLGGPPPGSG